MLIEGVKRGIGQALYLAAKAAVPDDSPGLPRGLRLPRGVVTISLDFELAWAWQYAHRDGIDPVERGLRERAQTPVILRKFDDLRLPTTWATVGHLFLDQCSRGPHGLAHEEMPRLQPFTSRHWRFPSGDWYQNDPCSSVRSTPAWYAPDLIEQILSSPVGHEIGCHTFSHASFGAHCPPAVAAAEIDACFHAMAKFGLSPDVWVFPRHDEGNFDVLAAKGVHIVRSRPVFPLLLRLPFRRRDGMWEVPVTSAIDRGKYWSREQRLARLKGAVDCAAQTGLPAHIWLHPSLPPREMTEMLFPFVEYCAERRDKGDIDVLTMGQLVRATMNRMKEEGA